MSICHISRKKYIPFHTERRKIIFPIRQLRNNDTCRAEFLYFCLCLRRQRQVIRIHRTGCRKHQYFIRSSSRKYHSSILRFCQT